MTLEEQIDGWRSYLAATHDLGTARIAELERRLRDQVAVLARSGLSTDEAFLIAAKRVGTGEAAPRDGDRADAERLLRQLVAAPTTVESGMRGRMQATVAVGLAIAAAIAVKLPAAFGLDLRTNNDVYARNAALLVLPFVAAYFAWKRRLAPRTIAWIAVPFVVVGIFANVYPFAYRGSTEALTALNAVIALWLAVGAAYAGGRWRETGRRMDFIRFSGEIFIYYVLIALGGGVFTGLMSVIFRAIGLDAQPFFASWVIPCGAAGAVLVAVWLVDTRQGIVDSIAPVLARIFTPLFTVLLLAFLGTVLFTGRGVAVDRNVLIVFDLLLGVVLALLLYNLSARDPGRPAGMFDVLQVVLLVSALLVDAVALSAIAVRITAFGFSANRTAALGGNVILLINLLWSAVLYFRFMRGRAAITSVAQWQTRYLPVYAAWAAVIVLAFPPLFHFV